MFKLFNKSRHYPIKYDENGQTARSRAFELFEKGQKPIGVIEQVEIGLRTSHRYYYDWKKLPEEYRNRSKRIKNLLKMSDEFSDRTVKVLSQHFGMLETEVRRRLEEPWGVANLIKEKWPNYKLQKGKNLLRKEHREQEMRLTFALQIVREIEEIDRFYGKHEMTYQRMKQSINLFKLITLKGDECMLHFMEYLGMKKETNLSPDNNHSR